MHPPNDWLSKAIQQICTKSSFLLHSVLPTVTTGECTCLELVCAHVHVPSFFGLVLWQDVGVGMAQLSVAWSRDYCRPMRSQQVAQLDF